MIVFVTTAKHAYTHAPVTAAVKFTRTASYEALIGKKRLPKATYILTDTDRLSPASLHEACRLYGRLRQAGLRVLNNPARIRSRWGLLRALHDQGFNRSNAYRLEENLRPRRWPVFLGIEGVHRFPIPSLLDSWAAVERTAEAAMRRGVPRSSLIVVEYSAEPLRSGVFRKLAQFRIGARHFAHTCVHQSSWVAKHGTDGLATPELHSDELRIVRDNPHREPLERAFAIAAIEYGRADFGLVEGKVHLYEINTNPHVKFANPKSPAERNEAYALFRRNYLEALEALEG